MHKYKELVVWQKAREFVREVYSLTSHYPDSELYGLTSQIRRAAISIPSNIAEGAGKTSSREFVRFLEIAYSSSYEVESHLIISMDLDFISGDKFEEISLKLNEIQKMIYGLIQKLKKDD